MVEVSRFRSYIFRSPDRKAIQKLIFILLFLPISLQAQFPPGAGHSGSTALHADSSIFINWAVNCEVERGPIDISDPEAELASVGTDSAAVGKAGEMGIVSLGDGGMATLTFEKPITNGPGWDFAVFENGFLSGEGYFLELAFVEVSSDGQQFFRFPAVSLTDTNVQITNFDVMDPRLIHNLAGKYEYLYGTPFDLEELAFTPGLDVDRVTHVRVIDVVGSLQNEFASHDVDDQKINDPWPTAFPSSGFDLDAIGVIHEEGAINPVEEIAKEPISLFPNPVKHGEALHLTNLQNRNDKSVVIVDMLGQRLFVQHLNNANFAIPTGQLPTGVYTLLVGDPTDHESVKFVVCE